MTAKAGVLMEVAGLAAVCGGVAVLHWPSAIIVFGLALLLLAQGVGERET